MSKLQIPQGNHTVYLLHFDRPYRHARHYLGVTAGDVNRRIEQHDRGHGARLMQVIRSAGIPWRIARVWENVPRALERQLKDQHSGVRLCPICKGR